MSQAHPTARPKQVQTDTFAVFGYQGSEMESDDDLILVGRVEVPRYSQPSADGVKLSEDKRLSLAVYRALKQSGRGEPFPGVRFMVMTDLEGPMEFVEYEKNPAFDGVWNPEGEQ